MIWNNPQGFHPSSSHHAGIYIGELHQAQILAFSWLKFSHSPVP